MRPNAIARSDVKFWRPLLATTLSAAFLWALLLSVSPQLHARLHSDANRAEHSCAAILIASGNYEHVTDVTLAATPALLTQFVKLPALNPQWVQSPFLSACIFEHAPPARA